MKIVYNDPAAAQKRFIRIAWISYIVVVLLFTLRGMSVGQNVTTAIDGGLYSLIPLSGFFALIGLFFIPKSPWVWVNIAIPLALNLFSMVLLMGFLDGHGYFGMFGQYLGYMVAAPLFLLRSLVYFKQYG
ncbi:Uncharacterised protein [Aedoeadaptatus ivorii]|uniref:Uncharacterized protein n=1 Tax=Aedoeadaptatus ivorii TaxID=54006 RepID=A0A3S4Z2T2_9FIRM|nr:hypothetical protein [Peptoniphilus ivorii]VEJ34275.1 Uncharacterised protein [Peptoniphilus ivorii]